MLQTFGLGTPKSTAYLEVGQVTMHWLSTESSPMIQIRPVEPSTR